MSLVFAFFRAQPQCFRPEIPLFQCTPSGMVNCSLTRRLKTGHVVEENAFLQLQKIQYLLHGYCPQQLHYAMVSHPSGYWRPCHRFTPTRLPIPWSRHYCDYTMGPHDRSSCPFTSHLLHTYDFPSSTSFYGFEE